ncbi:MAG: hypothetical protein J6P61_04545 [Erysipelotrichaceae bacterium]|nr:hypothetical protein [Erysipelotrichaceae bacterium]
MDDPKFQEFLRQSQEKYKKQMEEGNFDPNMMINDIMEDVKAFVDGRDHEEEDAYVHATKDDILALDDDEMLVALSQKVYRITEDFEEDEEILEALNPVQTVYYVLDTLGDSCLDERFGDFLIEEPGLVPLVPQCLDTIGGHDYANLYRSFFMSSQLDMDDFNIDMDDDEDFEDVYDRIYDQYALYYFDEAFINLNQTNNYHGLLSRYLRSHMDDMLEGVED